MNQLHEVSSLENGAKIVFASGDYYSLAENLLKGEEPKWDNSNTFNKWMDGWQIPKKYKLEHNFVIIQLAAGGHLFFICVDTSFYPNEFPAQFSIQAANISSILDVNQERKDRFGKRATKEEIRCIERIRSETWPYLINRTNLESGCTLMNKRFFKVKYLPGNITHVRLNISPSGGISRLRIYGKPMHICTPITNNEQFDLVSRIRDGCCISYSNCHEGHPNNLLIPRKASIRTDGWVIRKKTNRLSISEGSQGSSKEIEENEITEWAVFKLGHVGKIHSVVIDTSLFEENAPSFVQVYGKPKDTSQLWQIIVPYTKVTPGTEQTISVTENKTYMTHVKLEFKPNGGINRFRVIGRCQFYDGHAC